MLSITLYIIKLVEIIRFYALFMHFYSTGTLIFVLNIFRRLGSSEPSIDPESFVRGVQAGHDWPTSKTPFKWH